jgi:predicted GNAT family N-acyltransferase
MPAADARGAIEVRAAAWPDDAPTLRALRRTVFVEEQGVPESLEWDGQDDRCAHVLALANREPVGTGRLLPTGKIGRLAVLPSVRRLGIGSRLLRRLVGLARERGLAEVYLHAQVGALPFYAAHGFVAEGPEFEEAGIAHRRMRLVLGEVTRSTVERAASAAAGAAERPDERR